MMRKSLSIACAVLVAASVASAAAAADCWQYHNFNVDYRAVTWIDPGDYDVCLETKAVGTLNGRYKVCWSNADFRTSNSIYGDGYSQIETVKYYTWLETKDGELEFIEWGWYDGDFRLETGMSKVVGGTGAFEGAIGTLSWPPRYPPLGPIVKYRGYICIPQE